MATRLWYIYGWIFVRPRRWIFWQMMRNCHLQLGIKHTWGRWTFPNLHWWLLSKTVLKFLLWARRNSLHKFRRFPFLREIIYRIACTTAGYAQNGGECYHCAAEEGDPVELSTGETGHFELLRTWSVGTMDGTDHRFEGITTCPRCGYREHYEDGSL